MFGLFKPSPAPVLADPVVTSHLYAFLALREHRLNAMVGITRVTPKISLLLYLYQRERAKEIAAMPLEEKLLATIQQKKSQIKALGEAAKGKQGEELQQIIEASRRLQAEQAEALQYLNILAEED